MQRAFFTLILCLLVIATPLASAYPGNYQEAKKIAKRLWADEHRTFYCGCSYDQYGIIDFKSCHYKPIDSRKDKRITWEHIVPVSWYGKKLSCWHQQTCRFKGKNYHGRECCQKVDKQFREMESDLHNLVPAIASVNQARKNYAFGEFYSIDKSQYYFNQCQIIINDKYRMVEPKDSVKGVIARIHFYMSKKYDIPLSSRQKRLFEKWNKLYPATEWEKDWDQKVARIQGNRNEFIK